MDGKLLIRRENKGIPVFAKSKKGHSYPTLDVGLPPGRFVLPMSPRSPFPIHTCSDDFQSGMISENRRMIC